MEPEPVSDGIPLEFIDKGRSESMVEVSEPAGGEGESHSDSETYADKMGRKIAKSLTGIREKNSVMREGTTFKVSGAWTQKLKLFHSASSPGTHRQGQKEEEEAQEAARLVSDDAAGRQGASGRQQDCWF
jgi:hypothetical protein